MFALTNRVLCRFSQIDYCLRCTFPIWRHWTAKYTPKGRWAVMIRTAVWRVGLVAVTAAVLRLVTRGEVGKYAEILRSGPDSIKSVLRETLLRALNLLG